MTLQLEPIVEGKPDGPTLFFIQGWPDDASLWDGQVAALRDRYRCVRVNLPNYGAGERVRWGYSTHQIVDALAACVRRVSPGEPVTLVIHDWGAYWGYILHHRHPELVARLAGLDIAPYLTLDAATMLGGVAYQGWLLGAFLLGGPVGHWMTRAFARSVGAPGAASGLRAEMNYPYRNFWRDSANGQARRDIEGYWPRVPLLFVYGEKKPFMFHSERWLEHVRSVGGEVVGLACGHWVPRHPGFTEVLASWLERSAGPASGSR